MNYNNPIPLVLSNIIRISCAVLFVLFSFFYLLCIQGYVLESAQYVFSGGATSYSLWWGAIIITLVLMCIQFVASRFARLSGHWYALTYAPSFFLLAMVTSLYKPTISDFSFKGWLWALPLFIIVYIVFISMMRRRLNGSIEQGDYSAGRYLWTNFILLLLMMLACGSNAPANDVYMYELKAEHYLLDDDYEAASRVGERSLETSPRLNELRMYALARQGLLGERLFDYPQPYGERSLILFDDTVSRTTRFTSRHIQQALGGLANESVTEVDQYLDLLRSNKSTQSNRLLPDYVLCSKLLQGDMRTFYRLLPRYYATDDASHVMRLPRAYREALLLQAKAMGRNVLNNFADTLMLANYKSYCEIKASEPDSLVRANRLHRQFGNTLWWHLDYE